MKIIHQDSKSGDIVVIPENLDDIWHLHNIIQQGDLVTALTYRTDENNKDETQRAKKAEKKRMKLGIRVEKVTFHQFSDRLRIQGTIETGPQDLGSHHTLNITAEDMDKITINKQPWKNHHLQRLKQAVETSKTPQLIFVSLDDDTATIAILRHSGLQHIADIDSHRSGKQYDSKDTTHSYFEEITQTLTPYKKEETPMIILGPGFTRDHFLKYGRDHHQTLFNNTQTHATGNAGLNGIHEALKTGILDQITKDNRVAIETKQITTLMEEIKKDGLVSYGYEEVQRALENGACDRLLITDIHARTPKGEHLLDLARDTQSQWTIINTMHEAGKTFEGIGGIAALLRFKI